MKLRILKFKNWLILSLLGLLGVSGCRSLNRSIRLLYGVPDTDYAEPMHPKDSIGMPEVEPAEPDTLGPAPEPREEIRLLYGVPTTQFRE